MRRFSKPLLLTFTALLGLLVVIALALFLKKPVPVATDDDDDDDDDQPSALAVSGAQGSRFDATFGSLAALVPQGGSAPVLTPASGMVGSAMPDAGSALTDAPVTHGDQYRDVTWLQGQGADAYTLQVLGARSEAAVKQFIAGQKDPDQFHYFQSAEGGQPWFVVVYGNYGSRVQAIGTATGLDFGLDTRPFAKAFSDYVGEINGTAPAPAAASASAPEPITP